MNRLADMRPGVENLDQAKFALQEIAQITCRLEYQRARVEKQIASIKAKLADLQVRDNAALAATETDLNAFIVAHPDLFQKPRKIVTEFGSFGLQAVNEVVIEDEETLIRSVMESAYLDCYQVVRVPIKAALKARLEAKEKIPGCILKTGDTAVYKVAKTLIDEAKEKAAE